jgi:hypothetical protein
LLHLAAVRMQIFVAFDRMHHVPDPLFPSIISMSLILHHHLQPPSKQKHA